MNLLVTGAWQDANKYIEKIKQAGHNVLFMQQEKDNLSCDYNWVNGVVCNGLFLYHPISKFVNLRYIQLTSAGFDRVPMDEIQKRKITVHNARDVYSIPMAEFAMAGVLDIYKDMAKFREQQKKHDWIKNRQIRELAGSRVVIIGCGSVGTECAKRFKAFGCEVIGIDISVIINDNYSRITTIDKLDEEIAEADIAIVALPLNEYTRGLIDSERLNHINGLLVNISRGGVIDQKALEEWDGAAVLDVFQHEPLSPECLLWDKENTIITPHNSFVSEKNGIRLARLILSNLGVNNE